MDSSWNIGSIGIAGPPLRGPSSGRLIAEPPLSPPVSAGSSPVASAQPLEPAAPMAPPMTPSVDSMTSETFEPAQRAATSLESLLMRFRLITSDQLDEALREKRESGKDVGAIVVERGWVNEDQLARLLTYAPALPPPTEPVVDSPEPAAEAEDADLAPAREPEGEATPVQPAEASVEPEPIVAAGPVVSADPEPTASPTDEAAATPEPAYEIPPALELVDPEVAVESEPSVATFGFEPVVPAAEPQADPEPEEQRAESTALVPVQTAVAEPAGEPVAEPVAIPAAPEPELVHSNPEPTAIAEPEPPAPALEPEPQTVRFVEPAAIETIARVFVRLSNGERVEAGSFDDVGAAKARAEEVVGEISQRDAGWPFFGGRYIRPEAIVSVDVDATVVRYA